MVSLEYCEGCGGQLAHITGTLTSSSQPGALVQRNSLGMPSEKDLEKDENGNVTDRARRGVYLGCGRCGRPVDLDHPIQRKLDKQWKELDAKEKKELDRAKNASPAPTPIYADTQPIEFIQEQIDKLTRLVAEQEKKIKDFQNAVEKLRLRIK
jgi:hypothetical protein